VPVGKGAAGSAPPARPGALKALFEVVAGPLAQPGTPGVRFAGLRTVAFDGCNSHKVPDTNRNRWWLGRIRYRMGFAGYPALRLMALAETGTRGLLGAALGSAADRDEATVARRLLPLLCPGMLVLLDRAFGANAFPREVAATGALLVARAKSTRHPLVLGHLPDGSYLSDRSHPLLPAGPRSGGSSRTLLPLPRWCTCPSSAVLSRRATPSAVLTSTRRSTTCCDGGSGAPAVP
jgi:hypothetical protein